MTTIFYCKISLLLISTTLSFIKSDFTSFDSLYPQVIELIKEFENYESPLNNSEYWINKDSNNVTNTTLNYGTFDFIIVGGGTAGGVLANRLTEVENFTVLVIEAGLPTPDVSAVLGLNQYMFNTKWNWGYKTTPQQNACLRSENFQCDFQRGKVLGGSSSINGGVYVRGNADDYNRWEELGNTGWTYNDLLPYFKKSEFANITNNNQTMDVDYHGFSGLQTIEIAEDDTPEFTQMLKDGFAQLGLVELDYNGKNQIGYSKLQHYKSYNVRTGSNYSFIRPVRNRQNLHIVHQSLVTNLRLSNKTAVGVEFIQGGQKYYANASKEVILSAGAINTPQILILSGIGPKYHLKDLDIDVIADLPVGRNFQDHVFVYINFKFNRTYANYTVAEKLNLWFESKRPYITAAQTQIVSFWSLDFDDVPEIEISTGGPFEDTSSGEYSTGSFAIVVLHPKSVGTVSLGSNSPVDFPLIDPNIFSLQDDIESMYKGVQIALALFETPAYKKLGAEPYFDAFPTCDEPFEKLTKDWWICVFKHIAVTFAHPTGTTTMGENATNSVVDKNLKVHGINRLRVVDAGVIPYTISGHLNAPTVMLAEKISDVIKNDWK